MAELGQMARPTNIQQLDSLQGSYARGARPTGKKVQNAFLLILNTLSIRTFVHMQVLSYSTTNINAKNTTIL